jgi:methionyl aminopeptidase
MKKRESSVLTLVYNGDIAKPGVRYRDFGKIIEDYATKNGFSVVRTFCGHGINQLFHTAPNVPHYASKFISI